MHVRLLSIVVLATTACYSTPSFNNLPCMIRCTDKCPGDMTCTAKGVCAASGDTCDNVPPLDGGSDASDGPMDAPPMLVDPVFKTVSAGTDFACGIDDAKGLWCWGSNAYHQIDSHDVLVYPQARHIGTDLWDMVSTGGGHVCGIQVDGLLYCWGRNDVWQAKGGPGDVKSPARISFVGAPATWTFVTTGARSTCAIGTATQAGGPLYCWGHDHLGSLGTDDITNGDSTLPPTQEIGLRNDWMTVSLGVTHSCGIASGNLICFGVNENGATGNGPSAQNPYGKILVPLVTGKTWHSVAVSGTATCATTEEADPANDELWCFGAGGQGERGGGTNDTGNATVPTRVGTTVGWKKVAGSHSMLCGLRGTEVDCWGTATIGGLGRGIWSPQQRAPLDVVIADSAMDISLAWSNDYTLTPIPTTITDAPTPLTSKTAQHELGCAVVNSAIKCWGDNRGGQLGSGSSTRSGPLPLHLNPTFTTIAVGDDHGCGLSGLGAVSCWGSTVTGQATGAIRGDALTACDATSECDVTTIHPVVQTGASKIATGNLHTCALHDGTEISCWGDNHAQQLGGGTAANVTNDVTGSFSSFSDIFQVGRNGQCAVSGGTVCWGDVESTGMPTLVSSLNAYTTFARGLTFECFLNLSGDLYCRGANDKGQFGTGSGGTITGPPIAITHSYKYETISASALGDYACGLRDNHKVECWGENKRGQTSSLDLMANTTSPAPVPIPLNPDCQAISTSVAPLRTDDSVNPAATSCALCGADIYCWGDNRQGGLGQSNRLDDDPQRPTKVDRFLGTGDSWASLHGGAGFTCARTAMGHVQCWGFAPHGGLGNGGIPSAVPVKVQAIAAPLP